MNTNQARGYVTLPSVPEANAWEILLLSRLSFPLHWRRIVWFSLQVAQGDGPGAVLCFSIVAGSGHTYPACLADLLGWRCHFLVNYILSSFPSSCFALPSHVHGCFRSRFLLSLLWPSHRSLAQSTPTYPSRLPLPLSVSKTLSPIFAMLNRS